MPLILHVKPREKIVLNGAVLENVGPETMSFALRNRALVMLERDVILPERATTPLLRVAYALQSMFMDPDRAEEHRRAFARLAGEVYATVSDPGIREALAEALDRAGAGEFYPALKALRRALPLESALLEAAGVAPAAAGAIPEPRPAGPGV